MTGCYDSVRSCQRKLRPARERLARLLLVSHVLTLTAAAAAASADACLDCARRHPSHRDINYLPSNAPSNYLPLFQPLTHQPYSVEKLPLASLARLLLPPPSADRRTPPLIHHSRTPFWGVTHIIPDEEVEEQKKFLRQEAAKEMRAKQRDQAKQQQQAQMSNQVEPKFVVLPDGTIVEVPPDAQMKPKDLKTLAHELVVEILNDESLLVFEPGLRRHGLAGIIGRLLGDLVSLIIREMMRKTGEVIGDIARDVSKDVFHVIAKKIAVKKG